MKNTFPSKKHFFEIFGEKEEYAGQIYNHFQPVWLISYNFKESYCQVNQIKFQNYFFKNNSTNRKTCKTFTS